MWSSAEGLFVGEPVTAAHADDEAAHADDEAAHADDGTMHADDGAVHADDGTMHADDGAVHADDGTAPVRGDLDHVRPRRHHRASLSLVLAGCSLLLLIVISAAVG